MWTTETFLAVNISISKIIFRSLRMIYIWMSLSFKTHRLAEEIQLIFNRWQIIPEVDASGNSGVNLN